MESSITEAELLDALHEALGDRGTEDGLTSREIIKSTGWGKQKVLTALENLIAAGKWEPIKVARTSILTGTTRPVSGYRPVVSGD